MDRREGTRWAWPVRVSRGQQWLLGRKHFARQSGETKIPPLSPLWFIACQRLPHIRSRNPELSRNPRWADARLEGGANGIHLTSRQRNFDDIHGASLRNLINLMQLLRRQRGVA
jgi:hypothetical protein